MRWTAKQLSQTTAGRKATQYKALQAGLIAL